MNMKFGDNPKILMSTLTAAYRLFGGEGLSQCPTSNVDGSASCPQTLPFAPESDDPTPAGGSVAGESVRASCTGASVGANAGASVGASTAANVGSAMADVIGAGANVGFAVAGVIGAGASVGSGVAGVTSVGTDVGSAVTAVVVPARHSVGGYVQHKIYSVCTGGKL